MVIIKVIPFWQGYNFTRNVCLVSLDKSSHGSLYWNSLAAGEHAVLVIVNILLQKILLSVQNPLVCLLSEKYVSTNYSPSLSFDAIFLVVIFHSGVVRTHFLHNGIRTSETL